MAIRSRRRGAAAPLAGALVLAAPALALAAPGDGAPGDFVGALAWWFARAFHSEPWTALDYVLIVVSLMIGAAVGVMFYRTMLLPALTESPPRSPSSVKLRSLFLGLAIAALLMALSPHLPIGIFLIFTLVCVGAAVGMGLSIMLAAGLFVAVVALLLLWVSGWMAGVFGG